MTSHDVIDTIRRVLGIKKAGHTGTLDPGAAGVLVVCLGVATRLARFLLNDDKEYRAEITFGLTTSTGDSFGDKIAEGDARQLTEHDTRSTLELFTGAISQVPPMTSALKWHGQKLYELARSGQVVDRPARTIKVHSLEYIWGTGWGSSRPKALLHISCSKGTYIRTLCTDMGKHLGCGAHMSFLVRTRAGSFKIEDSHTLEEIRASVSEGTFENLIVNMEEALAGFPSVAVRSGAVKSVTSGSKLYLPGVEHLPIGLEEGNLVRLTGPEGLLAVAETLTDPEKPDRCFFKPICVLSGM
jgi:tRNA pseudouridine55 synthase